MSIASYCDSFALNLYLIVVRRRGVTTAVASKAKRCACIAAADVGERAYVAIDIVARTDAPRPPEDDQFVAAGRDNPYALAACGTVEERIGSRLIWPGMDRLADNAARNDLAPRLDHLLDGPASLSASAGTTLLTT
jgi:hypothetical protein